MHVFDFTIIGGGIVGLSTARCLSIRYPKARMLLLEKEDELACHQTGRNSGVIHSGIYYKPGSFKARFAKAGSESMIRFCEQNCIPYEICGKLIVATNSAEIPQLEKLLQRGIQNQVPVELLTAEQVKEVEPHVKAVAGLHVKSTGITNYRLVAQVFASQFQEAGGMIRLGSNVLRIRGESNSSAKLIQTTKGDFESKFIINCAGLFSDRIARMNGVETPVKIVPFRGEYFEIVKEKRYLVRNLIYPVPNPDFPFLGVHFTRMIDGSVHAGPNAVLAFSREGYRKSDFNLRDFSETICFNGFRKLAWKHSGEGLRELYRSFSKSAFTKSLQRLVPEIRSADLIPCEAGIRAQALSEDGALVDDFQFISTPGMLSVCNAPSPAATASIEIGDEIVTRMEVDDRL
jgi:L-2-hydroxyglutarate oxidase